VLTRITGRGVFSCVPPNSARTGIAGCGTGTACPPVRARSNQVRCFLIGVASGGFLLHGVLVVESAKDRLGLHCTPGWKSMPLSHLQPREGPLLTIGSHRDP
jgi:hypothetical protein